jgi:hypothetical protein
LLRADEILLGAILFASHRDSRTGERAWKARSAEIVNLAFVAQERRSTLRSGWFLIRSRALRASSPPLRARGASILLYGVASHLNPRETSAVLSIGNPRNASYRASYTGIPLYSPAVGCRLAIGLSARRCKRSSRDGSDTPFPRKSTGAPSHRTNR